MDASDNQLVAQAISGDEDAFAQLVLRYQGVIKSYLYRLTACREDAEDLAQEVWIRVFTQLGRAEEGSSVRTWLFATATHVAMEHDRARARWPVEAQDKAKALADADPEILDLLHQTHWGSPHARYEMREHIDFCFTCIMKTLPLDEHIAFMLCEIYDCTNAEAAEVLGRSVGAVKGVLDQARATMKRIFEQRCSLINPQGLCHQCPELNGLFNPYQAEPQELANLELVRAAQHPTPQDLLVLRTALVRSIDPLNAAGTNLHEVLMQVVRQASGSE
ncbi:MAG TPA: RNA polymerase sigma factor [Candidatus Tectomicrobia bacterium]